MDLASFVVDVLQHEAVQCSTLPVFPHMLMLLEVTQGKPQCMLLLGLVTTTVLESRGNRCGTHTGQVTTHSKPWLYNSKVARAEAAKQRILSGDS